MTRRRNPSGGGGGGQGRPGNGGGGNGGGNDQTPRRRRTGLEKRARRDVRISQQPYFDQLNRAEQAAQSAYGGYQDLIQPLAGQYRTQTADIAGNLTNQLGALSAMLGGDTPIAGPSALPGAEMQAGANLGTGLGAGALEMLAGMSQRNLGYQQSAMREGGLAERTALDNIIQERLLAKSRMDDLFKQRMDELRQQALENRLVKSQLEGDKAFSQYLQSMIGGMIGGNGGGRNRGGNGGGPGYSGPTPGGGTTDPDTGTVPHAQIDNQGAGTTTPRRRRTRGRGRRR